MALTRFRKIAIVSVSVIVVLVGIVSWLAIDLLKDPFNYEVFIAEKWAQRATYEVRARMARDLVCNHLPHGLKRSQVTALLGPPDRVLTGHDNGGHRLPGHETYAYYIGSWSTYGFDDAFVYVSFGCLREGNLRRKSLVIDGAQHPQPKSPPQPGAC